MLKLHVFKILCFYVHIIHVFMYTHIYKCMHLYVCKTHTCVCSIRTCIYTHRHVYMLFTHMYKCVLYVHMHPYTHMYTLSLPSFPVNEKEFHVQGRR